MNVTFDHSQDIAKHIKSFYFRPEKPTKYIAGQFIELFIPHDNPDERGIKHWFTLSSSPTEELLTITTKLASPGSTFKKALQGLKSGAPLTMHSPMGDFVLPKDPSIPLLFVAGGIGCTPFRSMIKYLQDTGQTRDIRLLYSVKSTGEIAFQEIFDKLGDNFQPLVGEQITTQTIIKNAGPAHYIYLSGPEPMIEIIDNELKQSGISSSHIRTDFFMNYTAI